MIKNIRGIEKVFFNMQIKIVCFFYFLPELFKGNLKFREFAAFLKRLLFFLFKLQHNKFVKIGKYTRLCLYIPGFPSKAFFTTCKKFMVFNKKLPDTTVLISITSACKYNCSHCYQKNDKGKDVNIDRLIRVIKQLQNMGIAFFNIEGGEPFLVYNKLIRICEIIDDRSEIWINSTGDGMTIEKLKELKKINVTAIMFSMHSPTAEKVNEFMGSNHAWDNTIKGINLCHKAGIPVALNMCLKIDGYYNGIFEQLMENAKKYNVSIIQLIKPKPAGGWLESGVEDYSEKDIYHVKTLVDKYNNDKKYKDYPSISAQIIEEDKEMFGCTAGGTDRFYINAKGDLQPCEFLNISFGNIAEDDFNEIYEKMRSCFEEPGECWLCEKYSKNIYNIYIKNKLKTLPLNKKMSKEIYENWNRGSNTRLYSIIKNM